MMATNKFLLQLFIIIAFASFADTWGIVEIGEWFHKVGETIDKTVIKKIKPKEWIDKAGKAIDKNVIKKIKFKEWYHTAEKAINKNVLKKLKFKKWFFTAENAIEKFVSKNIKPKKWFQEAEVAFNNNVIKKVKLKEWFEEAEKAIDKEVIKKIKFKEWFKEVEQDLEKSIGKKNFKEWFGNNIKKLIMPLSKLFGKLFPIFEKLVKNLSMIDDAIHFYKTLVKCIKMIKETGCKNNEEGCIMQCVEILPSALRVVLPMNGKVLTSEVIVLVETVLALDDYFKISQYLHLFL